MSPYRMSKIEAGVRTVIEFNGAFNRHDVAAMMQLMSEDCLLESFHPTPDGKSYCGRESISQYWLDFMSMFPGAQIDIEDIFGLGKRCIMRWKLTWTDQSGEDRHLRGVDLFKVQDDAICEELSYTKR